MDKSFLGIAGFAPLLSRFLRQKNSLRFGEKRKQGGSIRKPPFGFTVSKGFGRQYCMQSVPLAVLKRQILHYKAVWFELHAIRTACGIETIERSILSSNATADCMQSVPLAVLKQQDFSVEIDILHYCMQSVPLAVLKPAPSQNNSFWRAALHAIRTACGIETFV